MRRVVTVFALCIGLCVMVSESTLDAMNDGANKITQRKRRSFHSTGSGQTDPDNEVTIPIGSDYSECCRSQAAKASRNLFTPHMCACIINIVGITAFLYGLNNMWQEAVNHCNSDQNECSMMEILNGVWEDAVGDAVETLADQVSVLWQSAVDYIQQYRASHDLYDPHACSAKTWIAACWDHPWLTEHPDGNMDIEWKLEECEILCNGESSSGYIHMMQQYANDVFFSLLRRQMEEL